jgi:hypothetical protein
MRVDISEYKYWNTESKPITNEELKAKMETIKTSLIMLCELRGI